MMVSSQTFALLAPEIVLVAAALVAYLAGAFAGTRAGWSIALAGILAAIFFSAGQPGNDVDLVSGGVRIDAFSTFMRWAVLVLGGVLGLVQAGDIFRSAVSRSGGLDRGLSAEGTCEEAGTFLLLLAGLSLAAVADDLVLLFVGLELVSIPTYLLLGLKRTDAHGQEAALKYFFLSLVASALFLYAAVCLYGIGGSTNLAVIGGRLRSTAGPQTHLAAVLLPVAIGMAVAGAAFRLAAVPMHFYAPDVYEGTSPGNAALLSTLPKLAGLVVLVRLLGLALDPGEQVGQAATAHLDLLWRVIAILAAVTMTLGNLMALVQRNLRRLLACSSIAHAGYLLVGVAAAAASANTTTARLGGVSSSIFYLVTYALATLGIFAAVTYLGHRWPEWTAGSGPRPPREEVATVDDLDGLSTTNPVAAFALALFLLSLAGIPPLPGFWGKLFLVTSALEVDGDSALTLGTTHGWFVALSVLLVINAAIAAGYYLRIIAAMYFRTTRRGVQADGGLSAGLAMLLCTVLVLMVTLQPRGLFVSSARAGDAVERGLR
jgi:NADH-quinone oxidoreductase subunit N